MIDKLVNWKKYPASVFVFALPLVFIGWGSLILLAYLHWKLDGDLRYAAIVIGGLVLLGIGLWPVRKQLFHS